jgi:hypothetical protein
MLDVSACMFTNTYLFNCLQYLRDNLSLQLQSQTFFVVEQTTLTQSHKFCFAPQPQNVFLLDVGGHLEVKIGDFGRFHLISFFLMPLRILLQQFAHIVMLTFGCRMNQFVSIILLYFVHVGSYYLQLSVT